MMEFRINVEEQDQGVRVETNWRSEAPLTETEQLFGAFVRCALAELTLWLDELSTGAKPELCKPQVLHKRVREAMDKAGMKEPE